MGRDRGDGPESEESRLIGSEEENLIGGMGVADVRGVGYAPGEVGGVAQRGALNAPPFAGPRPPVSEIIATDHVYEAEHEAAVDARYDAMTPAERDKTYVHRGLWTRIKQFWTGV